MGQRGCVRGGQAPAEGEAPVSYQEERFFRIFSATLGDGGVGKPAGPDGYVLEGALDVAALEQALNAFLSRHRVLWSRFSEVGGRVVKRLEPVRKVALRTVDLRALPAEERIGAVMKDIAEHQHSCDDLSKPAPRFAVTLFRLQDQRHAVAAVSTLGVFDDDSWAIFWRELSDGYARAARGTPPETALHPVQYADYALWQREWHQGEELQQKVTSLKRHLEGGRPISSGIPTDFPRGPVDARRRQNFYAPFKQTGLFAKVSPEVTAAVRRLAAEMGAPLEALTFGAFAAALGRRTGDVVLRTTYSTRPSTDGLEGVVGFFSNFAYLRLDLSGELTFRELSGRAQREVSRAKSLPELQVVPFVFPDVDDRFRVLFVHYYDVELQEQLRIDGLAIEPLPFGDYRSLFYWPMHWQDWSGGVFEQADGGMGLRVLCNSALWSEATARSVGDDFVRILGAGATSPDAPLPAAV